MDLVAERGVQDTGEAGCSDRASLGTAVHLWLAVPGDVTSAELVQAYQDLMSPGELARHGRLRFARHRHAFAVSRALVRTTLSRYADVPPAAWRFRAGPQGRPEISAPSGHEALRFNLSHTEGLVGCAVTLDHAVGFDVESVERGAEIGAIAQRFFSPSEARALDEVPAPARRRRFFEYWTLKEAYVKATGRGLTTSLSSFAVRLARDESIDLDVVPEVDDPAAWQFALLEVHPVHVAALAVRRGGRPDLDLQARRVVPLAAEVALVSRVIARSRRPADAP
jgi:4'-phosphopantetheinyl transferase